jgi:hypothetical protein
VEVRTAEVGIMEVRPWTCSVPQVVRLDPIHDPIVELGSSRAKIVGVALSSRFHGRGGPGTQLTQQVRVCVCRDKHVGLHLHLLLPLSKIGVKGRSRARLQEATCLW